MNNKDNKLDNMIDNFIDSYNNAPSNNKVRVKMYKKKNKVKSGITFGFCLLILIFLIRLFSLNTVYFVLLFGDVGILIFNGINLFSKNGLATPYYVDMTKEEYEMYKNSGVDDLIE